MKELRPLELSKEEPTTPTQTRPSTEELGRLARQGTSIPRTLTSRSHYSQETAPPKIRQEQRQTSPPPTVGGTQGPNEWTTSDFPSREGPASRPQPRHSAMPGTSTRQASWVPLTLRQACCQEFPDSAICVQNFNDSRGIAIRMTYRISLRSSSLWEPRHPLLKVVKFIN